MGVTAQTSTQVTKIDAGLRNYASDYGGVTRCYRFDHVQVGVGTTTSDVELVRLPPGRFKILLFESQIEWTAMGTGETMDIGYRAYTAVDGTPVAVALAAFDDDVDVAAAGHAAFGSDLVATSGGVYQVESRDGLTIVASFTTIQDAAELHGYVLVSQP